MCAYISAWASVLLVQSLGQFQGLVKRNSNSAVPLFCVLLLSMSNFSLDVQGILRTSRYEEKLLVDLVTDSKRTNKNQRIFCPTNKKTLPLQSKETAKLTSNNYGETRNYIKSHV